MTAHEQRQHCRQFWIAATLSLLAALAFYFSTNPTLRDLDYTVEIASALLRGDLGLREKPPEWLNEMIPWEGRYYSAFPLGAVLSMVPVALLQKASLIHDFPGAHSGRVDCRSLRVFLLSARESIRTRLLQPQSETTGSANFVGAFPSIWNLDLVQPWNGRCVANRSRSCGIGRNRSSLFHVGATVAFHRRGFFRACCWKSDRVAHHSTFLPLSFLAPPCLQGRRLACRSTATGAVPTMSGSSLKRKYFRPVAHRSKLNKGFA